MRKITLWKICIIWLFICSLFSACGSKQPIDPIDDMNTDNVLPDETTVNTEINFEDNENLSTISSVWDARYEKWKSGEYETEATLSEEIYQAGVVRNKQIGDIVVNYSFYLSEADYDTVVSILKQESIPVTNDVLKSGFTDWFSFSVVDEMCIKEYTFPVDFHEDQENMNYFIYKEIILEGTYANQKISFCGYVSDYLYETIYEIVESYLTDLP